MTWTGTPTTAEPSLLTLEELKSHLRITDTTDDAYLSSLIADASAIVRRFIDCTSPTVTESRVVRGSGSAVNLREPCAVTALAHPTYGELEFTQETPTRLRIYGAYSDDNLTVTGTWGYAAVPRHIARAAMLTAATAYLRIGTEGAFIGRLDALPKEAADLLGL